MISATPRLRLKPCLPVEQNVQFSAHPACVETHKVPRVSSGMYTASTALPVPASSSHLRVPSSDRSSRMMSGVLMHAHWASLSRNTAAISVIAEEIVLPDLVYPAHQLTRTKRLLAHSGEISG